MDLFGKPLAPGEVAVDPGVVPIGTRLSISGYTSRVLPQGGFAAVAADLGDAIHGGRIDIVIDSGPAVVSGFGIQHVTATVVK